MRRRLFAAVALLFLSLALPVTADERAPSAGERFAKFIRIVKKILVPSTLDEWSWPKP